MARHHAGEAAAPVALAEAAEVADEVHGVVTALAERAREKAAAEAVTALQEWADIEITSDRLSASIAATMEMPDMTARDRAAAGARADDIASTMSSKASLAAAKTALERAIVSRTVADAAATVQAGVASDAADIVREVANSTARIRDDAVIAAATLYATLSDPDGPSEDT